MSILKEYGAFNEVIWTKFSIDVIYWFSVNWCWKNVPKMFKVKTHGTWHQLQSSQS